MASADEFDDFDDIPDEDWMLLNQDPTLAVGVGVGVAGAAQLQIQPLAPQNGHSLLPKQDASSLPSRLQTLSASVKHQQQPGTVFRRPAPPPKNELNRVSGQHRLARPVQRSSNVEGDEYDLEDLPSDAFDSSPERDLQRSVRPPQRSSQALRQTTLWGDRLEAVGGVRQSQVPSSRPFRADLAPEEPTHHELDGEALKTWVYPLNLGPPRDYQFSIVKHGLFNNTLVALPTGLGKTFIAATVMLNFMRWTKTAKVVFVAPTKPLASQQVQACLSIAGIPRSQAVLLTGETAPVLREGEWETKRLFFMTPQTLMNDLSKGYADPKSIALLVIDEAHRSTGDYAYVKAVGFIRRFSKSFRVLALTATPGSSVEGVQEVIDNLGISHVEIRTEESLDIRPYVHSRNIDKIIFDPSDEMNEVKDLFSKVLKPLVGKLSSQNIYYGRDPMSLTTYGLLKARQNWLAGPGRHANQGVKFMMGSVFTILQSLAHSIKLLNFHGILPFYHSLCQFRSQEEEKKGQGSKLRRQVLDDQDFQKTMSLIEKWLKIETFSSHPKIEYLCQTLVNHFMDAGEGSTTRAIVFSEYRDSAEELVKMLNKQPLVRATVFVGQATSGRSEGMKQAQQIETIEKFKGGTYNVLVATSIGEEGLDIGQVDLIVCYDASASPIRMLQRMGRTGRKRAGNIMLLLMKGREEDKFEEAKDNYQKMQEMICDGSRFVFRHDLSSRIVPRDIRPEVDKQIVEIPLENTQNPSLPEPKKSAADRRKKPAKKKFNMPDGVETGFTKASLLSHFTKVPAKPPPPKPAPTEADFVDAIPDLDKVILSSSQTARLDLLYRKLPPGRSDKEEITGPNLGAHPDLQRTLKHTVRLKHGEYTRRCVKLFRVLGTSQDLGDRYMTPYGESDTGAWKHLPVSSFAADTDVETDTEVNNGMVCATKRPRSPSWVEDDGDKMRRPAPKKRQAPGAKVNKAATPKRKAPSFTEISAASNSEEEESEDELEGESTSSPPRRGGARPRAAARGKGGNRGVKRLRRDGDNLEEVGDDCIRTSDLEETDGSDDGADLEGFVVDDDMATSSMQRGSTSPTTPDSPSAVTPNNMKKTRRGSNRILAGGGSSSVSKEKPFYVPLHFTLTQESEDDMPDFQTMVTKSRLEGASASDNRMGKGAEEEVSTPVTSQVDEDEEDEAVIQRTPVNRKRRRPVLLDSDDNE